MLAAVSFEVAMLSTTNLHNASSKVYHTIRTRCMANGLSADDAKGVGRACSKKLRNLWQGAAALAVTKKPAKTTTK